jgi:hypothetical protein
VGMEGERAVEEAVDDGIENEIAGLLLLEFELPGGVDQGSTRAHMLLLLLPPPHGERPLFILHKH